MLHFTRLCQEQNIPFIESGHHHCAEGWIQVNCPFCTDGTHGWHLGFSLVKGNMNCWRCGSHSVYDFIKIKLPGKSVKQILRQYDDPMFIPEKKIQKPRRKKAIIPPQVEPMIGIHRNYLLKKNFNPALLQDEWNLHGTKGFSKEWSWRIIAEIKNRAGDVTGYAGRALNDSTKPRWKFSRAEEMSDDPKQMLYGIEKVQDRVLIVEGVSDVWRMGAGAVATFGINWKVEQASILRNFSHRFIMYDNEYQAQWNAKALANWLAPFPGETEIISGLKTDPGDLSQNEADKIKKELGL